MLYVYAILDSKPKDLRCVGNAGVFAAVKDVEECPAIDESSLRDHDRIVRQLAAESHAILPARFGSIVEDDDALARLLSTRASHWQRALQMVAGREQMTLRVFGNRVAPPENTEGGPGTRYLSAKLREIPSLDALRPFVRAEHVERHGAPPLLASVYHLIERGRSADYLAAVAEAPSGEVQFAATGPWPPYAFGRWEQS